MTADWLNNISATIATGSAVAPFVAWTLNDFKLADGSLQNLILGCVFWLIVAAITHEIALRMVQE